MGTGQGSLVRRDEAEREEELKPLEEYTDDELVEELQRRHDHSVFAFIKERTSEMGDATIDYFGDPFKCRGLAAQIGHDISSAIRAKNHS